MLALGCHFSSVIDDPIGGFKIFSFIDNTMNGTCHPGGGPTRDGTNAPRNDPLIQRAWDNGWEKMHGMKWQTVDLPNGMNFHVFGPVCLRHNDLYTLAESDINNKLAQLQMNEPIQFFTYVDSAYMIVYYSHIKARYNEEPITPRQSLENRVMSSGREVVEWNYGYVGIMWSLVDRAHGLNRPEHRWKDQLGTIHIDESWFYLNRVTNQILVFDGIVIPNAPTVQHKSHIPKVMFIVAMARPFRKEDGTWFDGKLVGCWEIVTRAPAQRNSVNRPAGTMITKPQNLNADIYYDYFTREGGIKINMPWLRGRTVKIQQDGAKPHTGHGNVNRIEQFANVGGWQFRVVTQPVQSPDLNILDLGLFHSLKCRVAHIKRVAHNIDELIEKVHKAYADYDHKTLDHIWAHLIACWNRILRETGGNQYKPPHIHARTRAQNGQSSVDLTVDVDEYNRVFELLTTLRYLKMFLLNFMYIFTKSYGVDVLSNGANYFWPEV